MLKYIYLTCVALDQTPRQYSGLCSRALENTSIDDTYQTLHLSQCNAPHVCSNRGLKITLGSQSPACVCHIVNIKPICLQPTAGRHKFRALGNSNLCGMVMGDIASFTNLHMLTRKMRDHTQAQIPLSRASHLQLATFQPSRINTGSMLRGRLPLGVLLNWLRTYANGRQSGVVERKTPESDERVRAPDKLLLLSAVGVQSQTLGSC